jgi:hypothetical protein
LGMSFFACRRPRSGQDIRTGLFRIERLQPTAVRKNSTNSRPLAHGFFMRRRRHQRLVRGPSTRGLIRALGTYCDRKSRTGSWRLQCAKWYWVRIGTVRDIVLLTRSWRSGRVPRLSWVCAIVFELIGNAPDRPWLFVAATAGLHREYAGFQGGCRNLPFVVCISLVGALGLRRR